jgi:hypothetical protein
METSAGSKVSLIAPSQIVASVSDTSCGINKYDTLNHLCLSKISRVLNTSETEAGGARRFGRVAKIILATINGGEKSGL